MEMLNQGVSVICGSNLRRRSEDKIVHRKALTKRVPARCRQSSLTPCDRTPNGAASAPSPLSSRTSHEKQLESAFTEPSPKQMDTPHPAHVQGVAPDSAHLQNAPREDLRSLFQSLEERSKTFKKLAAEQEKLAAEQEMELAKFRSSRMTAENPNAQSPNHSCGNKNLSRWHTITTIPIPDITCVWEPQDGREKKKFENSARNLPTPGASRIRSSPSCSWQARCQGTVYGEEIPGKTSWAVWSPTSLRKMWWDLISALVIGYDVLVCPLTVFDYDQLAGAQWASLLTTVFWSIDLVLSFFFGFHTDEGTVEMRLDKVARRYLLSWFPIDSAVLVMDWILVVSGSENKEIVSSGRLNRLARFTRMVKVLRFSRLIRVFKLVSLLEALCQHIQSTLLITFLNIARLILVVSIYVHYVACCWCAIGFTSDTNEESWLSQWREQGTSSVYLYTIAFHWTLAQFLPAPATDHPRNFRERLFTILMLFAGFAVFSSTLGSVTALITRLRNLTYSRIKDDQLLRQFFEQNKVSHGIATQVLLYQTQLKDKPVECLTMKKLPILQLLPSRLQAEMMYQVCMNTLSEYPLIDTFTQSKVQFVKTLCATSIADFLCPEHEILFHRDADALCMRFVRQGRLVYYPWADSEVVDGGIHISDGAECDIKYLSEAALWTSWKHRGVAIAPVMTRVMEINSSCFANEVCKDIEIYHHCRHYAALFHKCMSSVRLDDNIDDTFRACISATFLQQAVSFHETLADQ